MTCKSYVKLLVSVFGLGKTDWGEIAPLLTPQHVTAIDRATEDLRSEESSGDRLYTTIKRFYGLGEAKATMQEIGSEFERSVSKARVHQFRLRAEGKLRQNRKLRPVAECLYAAGWENELIKRTRLLPTDAQLAQLQQAIATSDPQEKEEILHTIPIESLGFTGQTIYCLRYANIRTVPELCRKTKVELLRSPNFGRKSFIEVETQLTKLGLQLAEG